MSPLCPELDMVFVSTVNSSQAWGHGVALRPGETQMLGAQMRTSISSLSPEPGHLKDLGCPPGQVPVTKNRVSWTM